MEPFWHRREALPILFVELSRAFLSLAARESRLDGHHSDEAPPVKLLRGMRGRILLWLVLAGLCPWPRHCCCSTSSPAGSSSTTAWKSTCTTCRSRRPTSWTCSLTERREEAPPCGFTKASRPSCAAFRRRCRRFPHPGHAQRIRPDPRGVRPDGAGGRPGRHPRRQQRQPVRRLVRPAAAQRTGQSVRRGLPRGGDRLAAEPCRGAPPCTTGTRRRWRHRLYFFEDDDASRSYHLCSPSRSGTMPPATCWESGSTS